MKKLLLCAAILAIITVACSKKVSSSSGTAAKPTVTYALNIQPLIESKCAPCHLPTKGGRKTPFDSFEATRTYIDPIINRVQLASTEKGFMPFKNEALSAEEIALLKKWKEEGLAQ